ncbi:DUF3311 domain-containing protein [Natrinema salifodinae]|uniref:DUF3311 domain-containing protein n=1 Tax=Natrinema salifodinae TaxID=1202768 RepID=A0A1I0PII0_9EURY|nr:DUF3311 domain-containing protein [Natrinema salifodinae]SEW14018.1 Protein of unknown function [Natrinema salifodinae]
MRRNELVVWIAVAVVLTGLAIPWFLWGSATVVAGLPVWLWWHVAWLCLASVVFWCFAQRAWGLGIETRNGDPSDSSPERPDPARGSDTGPGGEFR